MADYAFTGPKWSSLTVSWSFATANLPGDTDKFDYAMSSGYQAVILRAFDRWASVSGLQFVQAPDSAQVNIRVGWADFPNATPIGLTSYKRSSAGFEPDVLVRIDDPSHLSWHPDGQGDFTYVGLGISLYAVALHEIGHALGLAHSPDPGAVMYSEGSPKTRDLNANDIAGIQALYGANPGNKPPPTPLAPTQAVTPNLAPDPGFTTLDGDGRYVTLAADSVVYVRSGQGQTVIDPKGAHTVTAGGTSSTIVLGSGNPTVDSEGRDTIFGGSGLGFVSGGAGYQIVVGGGKYISVRGGTGGGAYWGGGAGSTIYAGTGAQAILIGSNGDKLYSAGTAGDLFGVNGPGDVLMDGSDSRGQDVFFGAAGTGKLTFICGKGDDILGLGQGTNIVKLGAGNSTVFANTGTTGVSTITAGTGSASIGLGGKSVDIIIAAANAERTLNLYSYVPGATRVQLAGFAGSELENVLANQRTINGSAVLTLSDKTSISLIGVATADGRLFG